MPTDLFAARGIVPEPAQATPDRIGSFADMSAGDGANSGQGRDLLADSIEQRAQTLADQIEAVSGEAGAGELFGNAFALGLKDKTAGAAGAVAGLFNGTGFADGYRIARRAQEIIEDRARERSGALGTAAEIAGTVGTGVLAKAPAAATAVGRIMQGAREAGTLAAIQGAGDSQEDTASGILRDAAVSGATGAAAGGVLTGVVEGAKGLIKVARSAARGAGGALDDPAGKAGRKVYQALADDDVSPGLASARMRNRDTALINVADENTLGLGRAASAKPGEGRKIVNAGLDAQQRASQGRVLAAVDDALGGGDKEFNRRVADMIKTRSNLGADQYQKAFAKNFARGHSMKFDALAKRVPAEALTNARKIAAAEGRPLGEQLVAAIDDAGNVAFKRTLSLREWHYIQRGLRSAADSAYRQGVGEVGTAYSGLRKEILGAMDEASPLYKAARQQYASQSQMIDALQTGREILNPSTTRNVDQLADELAGMSKAERDAVKVGLARQMRDMIEVTPDRAGDMVRKVFGTEGKRRAIRAVFDSDSSFRKFESEMGKVAKDVKSFQFVRTGSRTSFVDAEKANAGALADAASAAMDATTGGVGSTVLRGATRLLRDMGGMDPDVARETARILMSRDPEFVRKALLSPAKRAVGQQARSAFLERAAPIARAITIGTASSGAAGVSTAR